MQDVIDLLNRSVNDVLQLENSINRARCIATLAGVLIRALEFGELEERLAAVEAALKGRHI